MAFKLPFFPKSLRFYQPLNGSVVNGASHAPARKETPTDEGQAPYLQILKRLQELEKHNESLKNIIELRRIEIDEIIAAHKNHISVLAHDLKSPFSTIYGVLGILKNCIQESQYDEMEEYIDIASFSALSTTHLIENILAWSTSQHKKLSFYPLRINLAEMVAQEIENCKISVKIKHLSFEQNINPRLHVNADVEMTKTIIRNLINNAIKFVKLNGKICISAQDEGAMIEVRVKDDGIGIGSNDQLTLFHEGSAQSSSDNGFTRRRGLGLLLCKEFVNIQGGTIRVESQQGKGSSFIFTLPKNA